jgi:CRP-like cAMP-binding protein
LIDQYVNQNNKEGAVNLIFDLIVKCAEEKKFEEAELLRKKLFEVDPLALSEIIRSAEIIEEKRAESIDQSHRKIWKNLYAALRNDEANALYYAMKERVYDVNEIVFKQGEQNSNLYFINQGQLKMIYHQAEREIFLRYLKAGEIAGQDTFFHNTVCTTSLVTLSRAQATYIEKETLHKWQTECPSLEEALDNYFFKFRSVEELLKSKNLDRRRQKRVKIQGAIQIQLIDEAGKLLGNPIKGELVDVSRGGLSFMLRITKKETALLLLGRKLSLQFAVSLKAADLLLGRRLCMQFLLSDDEGIQQKINISGTVVSVRSHPFDDYSIHIRFDQEVGIGQFRNFNP